MATISPPTIGETMSSTAPPEPANGTEAVADTRVAAALEGLGRQSHTVVVGMCVERRSVEDVAAELDLDPTRVAARAVHADREFRRGYLAPIVAPAGDVICDRFRKRLLGAALDKQGIGDAGHPRRCDACRAQEVALSVASARADEFLRPLAATLFLSPDPMTTEAGEPSGSRRRAVPWRVYVGVAFLLAGLMFLIVPPLTAPSDRAPDASGLAVDGVGQSGDPAGGAATDWAGEASGTVASEESEDSEDLEDPVEADGPETEDGAGPAGTDPGPAPDAGGTEPSATAPSTSSPATSAPSTSSPSTSAPSTPAPAQPADSRPTPTEPAPDPSTAPDPAPAQPAPSPTPAPSPAPSPTPSPSPSPSPEPGGSDDDDDQSSGLIEDVVGVVDDLVGGLLGGGR